MPATLATMRFTVEQYHAMGRAGILTEDDRVELIGGEIVRMSPIGSEHAFCVARVQRLFSKVLGEDHTVWAQNPIVLGGLSEPQPDVALLRQPDDSYKRHLPTAADVLLVVEVADTTVERDREAKLPIYSSFGIREAWLVNLPDEVVEVHRRPTKSGYKNVRRLRRGSKITPLAFPGVTIAVADILGPR